ncbi:hypothetical protein [Bacillus sp. FJAT-27445]|uniref:hypothetical protein n=1 Tax=Bacillus sp. FJAT-27445 TaxID=1679166 RepID=UPI00074357E6|nr:hypothetical protein [Bacillus sp. FJAT-27445]
MKFSIYKASNGDALDTFGTMEASSMEVAGDLLYKVLRRSSAQKDGDVFLIVPHSDNPAADNLLVDGAPFHILQYREID